MEIKMLFSSLANEPLCTVTSVFEGRCYVRAVLEHPLQQAMPAAHIQSKHLCMRAAPCL